MTVLRPLFFSRGSLSARTQRRVRPAFPQGRHAPQKAGAPVPFPRILPFSPKRSDRSVHAPCAQRNFVAK